MNRLAATGYASLDYPVVLAGRVAGDRTTRIGFRDPEAWPRIGGCPAYVALAAASTGQQVSVVTWVGSDAAGLSYTRGIAERGVEAGAVERLDGSRSPVAILAYQPDGSCACLFDPALAGREALSMAQRRVLSCASHICITVGPPHLTREILACRSEGARLYWVLKNDSVCFTPELRRELSAQAQVILGNRAEQGLIGAVQAEATIVETSQSEIRVTRGGASRLLAVEPLEVLDATGAGDSFAGGFIAAEMAGVADPIEAAAIGARCARQMLLARRDTAS